MLRHGDHVWDPAPCCSRMAPRVLARVHGEAEAMAQRVAEPRGGGGARAAACASCARPARPS
eukprot:6744783-Prymnesium_polylepis.1